MSLLDYLKDRSMRYKVNNLFNYMRALEEAVNGNIELDMDDDKTVDADVGDQFTYEVKLTDGDGKLHEWFHGTGDIDLSGDNDGSFSIVNEEDDLKFDRGIGEVVIEVDTATDGHTATITVSHDDVLGYSIADATADITLDLND